MNTQNAAHKRGTRNFLSMARLRLTVIAPGLGLAGAVGATAIALSSWTPSFIGPVLIAVLLGLAIGNTFSIPSSLGPGLTLASRRILRIGVVLLGARLSMGDVLGLGSAALLASVALMTVAFATMALLAKMLQIPGRLAVLLGVGTAVCGNSAILATAPIVQAKDKEISLAVGTITVFGTIALLAFPIIGNAVSMPDEVFGFWAGLSINDTSQVVAAGAAYSPRALEIATVVKLVRNALMAPLLLAIAWLTVRRQISDEPKSARDVRMAALKAFPLFVLGFLILAGLNSLGLITESVGGVMASTSSSLIVVAIAGVGLVTRLSDMQSIGFRAVAAVVTAAALLAVLGLVVSTYLFA